MPSTYATRARWGLFLAFTLSGFAGLIYESIWSHYLKLMLGHAAQAQTLVLVLFMGGMAIGAGFCGRFSARIKYPLLAYAAVELLLGVFALSFDPVFRAAHAWFLDSAAPALAQPWMIEGLKWGLAALMILPACVLLGATFPLISAGVVRLDPEAAGNALGWLYFSNSLGAAAGVLTSGFVLIELVGLPGTLMTAGLCNVLLALTVYGIGKWVDTPVPDTTAARGPVGNNAIAPAGMSALLITAFLTGAASFLYEIGWIRMLSLVLGSATHSFELMLGAFILGLALGALWIRNRIDAVRNPLRTLAWVQVFMATTALGSLVVYGWSFEWMGAIVRTLAKTDTGYAAFNLLSQMICWALMLPVTFFAGMTLPLITVLVFRTAAGEAAIGRVYAANTWGAIVGVIVAVHLAMPYLGLRNVVVLGAAVDLALGLWLFSKSGFPDEKMARTLLVATCALALAIASLVRFDPGRLASGVYRNGATETKAETVWRRDGRTASVQVLRGSGSSGDQLSILTNGKTDAALSTEFTTPDDYTQIGAAVFPLALNPDARLAAVVGMGSGRTSHVFLGSPGVEAVHTIEIESAMVEGARLFGPLTARTFTDVRSHIHIEDAKTYFARHQQRYDAIMSEPSNPWVSGVASLFSKEFYRQVKGKLAPGGVFAQWLQLYEFDDSLLASVVLALGEEFSDYAIYAMDNGNLLITAVAEGKLPQLSAAILNMPGVGPLAGSIGLRRLEDLRLRSLGGREVMEPYVRSFAVPANSDYFPYLDQHAAEYRFKKGIANGLIGAHPVTHRVAGQSIAYSEVQAVEAFYPTQLAQGAFQFWSYFDWKYREAGRGSAPTQSGAVLSSGIQVDSIMRKCDPNELERVWLPAMIGVATSWWPYMDPERTHAVVEILRGHACKGEEAQRVNRLLDWLDAIGQRDSARVSADAAALLKVFVGPNPKPVFAIRETLLADYLSGGANAVLRRAETFDQPLPNDDSIRYLIAVSRVQGAGTSAVH